MTMTDYTQHPDWDGPGSYAVCPICAGLIKLMVIDPQTVDYPQSVLNDDAFVQAVQMAHHHAAEQRRRNDELTLMHYQVQHTIEEVVLRMSLALVCLDSIHDLLSSIPTSPNGVAAMEQVDSLCHRGLGIE